MEAGRRRELGNADPGWSLLTVAWQGGGLAALGASVTLPPTPAAPAKVLPGPCFYACWPQEGLQGADLALGTRSSPAHPSSWSTFRGPSERAPAWQSSHVSNTSSGEAEGTPALGSVFPSGKIKG